MTFYEEFMNSLFPDNSNDSMEQTLEYYKNHSYKNISTEKGIYVIKKPKDFEIEISNTPEGPTSYKGKKISRTKKFDEKINYDNKLYRQYLYIGKTNNKEGICNRLSTYIKFGYAHGDINIPHGGGKRLWLIKNNKKLLTNYITTKEIKNHEDENIKKFYEKAIKIFEGVPVEKRNKKGTKQPITIECIIEAGLFELSELVFDNYLPIANENRNSYQKDWTNYWQQSLEL